MDSTTSLPGAFGLVRFVPLVFVVVGPVLVVVGLRRFVDHRRFLGRALRTGGLVTGHDAVRHYSAENGSSTSWYPLLRFTTSDGRVVDTRAMTGRGLRRPGVGERVEVLYDPLDPLRATLPGVGSTFVALVPVLIGLVFIPVGLAVFAVFTVVTRSL